MFLIRKIRARMSKSTIFPDYENILKVNKMAYK